MMGGKATKLQDTVPTYFLLRGLPYSGKTSLVYRLKHEVVHPHELRGRAANELVMFDRDNEIISFWEMNGRYSLRALTKVYFAHVDSVVYVVDSSNPEMVEESIDELNDIYVKDEILQSTILMVVANKQDLDNSISAQQLEDKIKQSCQLKLGITVIVMPTSVETGEGLEIAFDYFLALMKLKKEKLLKPGLIPGAWKKAEEQLSSKNFDDILIVKTKDFDKKMKNHFVKAMKSILNY